MQDINYLKDFFVAVIRKGRNTTHKQLQGQAGLAMSEVISAVFEHCECDNQQLRQVLNDLLEHETLVLVVSANWTWKGHPHIGNRYNRWRVWRFLDDMDFTVLDAEGRYVFDTHGRQVHNLEPCIHGEEGGMLIYWHNATLYVAEDGFGTETARLITKRPYKMSDKINIAPMLAPPGDL